MDIRHHMRKILPLRASTFQAYRHHEAKQLDELNSKIDHLEQLLNDILEQQEKLVSQGNKQFADTTSSFKSASTDLKHVVNECRASLEAYITNEAVLASTTRRIEKSTNEVLWAETFNSAIKGSSWIQDKPFCPGRWAVGYQFLYVLFRVLNEFKPENILELGLGQSTSMTKAYVASHPVSNHIVIEHDSEWISFYQENEDLVPPTDILQLDIDLFDVQETYGCSHEVRKYVGFSEALASRKFDLLIVDAPFGYDMKELARIDILDIVRNDCLASSFVIMVDDYDRDGEKGMVKHLKTILDEMRIEYAEGAYAGNKTTYIITSPDKVFLTSM